MAARTSVVAAWVDDRTSVSTLGRRYLRKVFPDHWSFMLGEIALWSFTVLLVTGVFLTFWFTPSMSESTYEGSYAQLRGVPMSDAYASTLHISFDVRGGLLVRQMHHWAAMVFIAAMFIHLMRVFVTGAFRKPREITWVIGATMLLLGILEGFAGYSLPDDLLSGTGLRIADGIVKATPVVGTYLSFFAFGGEFPGDAAIPRLYIVHVLLIPGLLLALVATHLLLIVYHKHTQWAGPGRTERNVVGYPFLPVYVSKATGFFFMVFGVIAAMGALLSINPIWKYGPYDPSKVTAGSQPDWYMGIAEGLLRIMPNWETHVWGHTISWNVLLPGQVLPFVPFVAIVGWPFLEAWVTGDHREHHVLQRPRDAPTRTAFLAAMVTVYGLLWAAGGNDILATRFHWSLNSITYTMRAAVFLGPVVVFYVARRWCLGLQRADHDRLLHGAETGVVVRSPDGGYAERHAPVDQARAFALTSRDTGPVHEEPPEHDENGIPAHGTATRRARSRLSRALFAANVPTPTAEELEDARNGHRAEELEPRR
jgi:ubiquinol-cytochrome c reductase cytochrome b subunit